MRSYFFVSFDSYIYMLVITWPGDEHNGIIAALKQTTPLFYLALFHTSTDEVRELAS
jgi:hypothetical protein